MLGKLLVNLLFPVKHCKDVYKAVQNLLEKNSQILKAQLFIKNRLLAKFKKKYFKVTRRKLIRFRNIITIFNF